MLDYFEDEDYFYLVMEKPEVVTDLYRLVVSNGGLKEYLSLHYFRQILNAIQYCHSVGVVHQDIKLDNVLIDLATKQAKLSDFGCASFLCDKACTDHKGETHVWPLTPRNY